MYAVSASELTNYKNSQRQVASITVSPLVGESFTITDADIVEGGLTLTRSSVTSSKLELGTAIASQLELKLRNPLVDETTGEETEDGTGVRKYADVKFEGARVTATVGIKDWSNASADVQYIPLGTFTVDNSPRSLSTISLDALDDMVKFDQLVGSATMPSNATVSAWMNWVCAQCNVTPPSMTGLPNSSVIVNTPTSENLTYRQLLQWLCQILGCCAYFDESADLNLAWYSDTEKTITAAERYSSDIYESAITVTGVDITVEDTVYSSGTSGYSFEITGNELISATTAQTIANALYAALGGFSYTPSSMAIHPAPYYFPLDGITYLRTNSDDDEVYTIITDVTYVLNGSTALKGQGETAEQNGYASVGALTDAEKAILATYRGMISETRTSISALENAMEDLNGAIASGLYATKEVSNGATIYYLHDRPELSDSQIVTQFSTAGIRMSSNGLPSSGGIWNLGILTSGDIIAQTLSVDGINANWINTGALTITDNNNSTVFRASVDSKTIEIHTPNFDLTTAGVITATGATVKGNIIIGKMPSGPAGYIWKYNYDDELDGIWDEWSLRIFGTLENGVETKVQMDNASVRFGRRISDVTEFWITSSYGEENEGTASGRDEFIIGCAPQYSNFIIRTGEDAYERFNIASDGATTISNVQGKMLASFAQNGIFLYSVDNGVQNPTPHSAFEINNPNNGSGAYTILRWAGYTGANNTDTAIIIWQNAINIMRQHQGPFENIDSGNFASYAYGYISAGNVDSYIQGLARTSTSWAVTYGTKDISPDQEAEITYPNIFSKEPHIIASYTKTGNNIPGAPGPIKIFAKTATSAKIIMGGTFKDNNNNTITMTVNWFAIGPRA